MGGGDERVRGDADSSRACQVTRFTGKKYGRFKEKNAVHFIEHTELCVRKSHHRRAFGYRTRLAHFTRPHIYYEP